MKIEIEKGGTSVVLSAGEYQAETAVAIEETSVENGASMSVSVVRFPGERFSIPERSAMRWFSLIPGDGFLTPDVVSVRLLQGDDK